MSLLACGRIDFASDRDTSVAGDATVEAGADGGMDASTDAGMDAADTAPTPPVCGNGEKEGDEECDDGNVEALDGCDPECRGEFAETGSCTSDEAIVVLGPQASDSTYPTIVAYPSDGAGGFGPAETIATGMDLRAIAIGHFDATSPQLDLLYSDLGAETEHLVTCSEGVLLTRHARGGGSGRSFADYDGDGCLDRLDYDYPCCNFGASGTGDGFTHRGDCVGGFETIPSCATTGGEPPCTDWNVRFLSGLWQAAATYNAGDWNGDGNADFLLASVASGGDSPSVLWILPGDGTGNLGGESNFGSLSEPSNAGDVGDIDGDGCVDWVLGPNDDGEAGAVLAVIGDCAGGAREVVRLLTLCPGAACYGDGQPALYDWNGDGALDVTGTVTQTITGPSQLSVWLNEGDGTFVTSVTVTAGFELDSLGFRVPLRPAVRE